jgi:hypothetical protein
VWVGKIAEDQEIARPGTRLESIEDALGLAYDPARPNLATVPALDELLDARALVVATQKKDHRCSRSSTSKLHDPTA